MEVIKYALMSEKALGMVDRENKITFIVDMNAKKEEIRKEVEKLTGARVVKINVIIDRKSRKKAVVKFDKSVNAQDIAAKVGLI